MQVIRYVWGWKLALLWVFSLVHSGAKATPADSVVHIAAITIEGNQRTKEAIILREMTLAVGDTVRLADLPASVARSRNNIFNLQLFLDVSVSVQTTRPHEVQLCIFVVERLYLLALPIVSLADRNFNEWWYERNRDLRRLTYGIQASHVNLTGNKDYLTLKAFTGFVPYFELSYGRPYVDKKQRMGIRGGVYVSNQRSIAYRTWEDKLQFITTDNLLRRRVGGFAELTYRPSLYHFHSVQAAYTDTRIADTIQQVNPQYFLSPNSQQRYASLSYDYRFDKRDNRQYALRGWVLQLQLSKIGLSKADNVDLSSISATYHTYFPIRKHWYGDWGIRGRVSLPNKQPYVLTSGLGYRNNLIRGYDLFVIDGQWHILAKQNVKYKILQRTFHLDKLIRVKQFSTLPLGVYAVGFTDVGYVRNTFAAATNSQLANRWLLGTGIGLDVVSWYDTMGRFTYSFNQLGQRNFFFTISRTL